ncbi:hypothetical protein AHF37_05398 [Paragonimus kellicotti]|nr:hypothetical protein AHF37_05398 [Paragonimus kellicotti]
MQSVVSQPNLVQHMQQMYPVSGVPSGQPAIVCSANRPASASLVPQGTTISGHLQTPLIMYQQVNPDKTVNRQTAVQAQPGPMAAAQILHHRADGCGALPVTGTNAVLIRTTSSGSVAALSSQLPSTTSGTLGPDDASLNVGPDQAVNVPVNSKPVITVLPGGQAKVVRPNAQGVPKTVNPAQGSVTSVTRTHSANSLTGRSGSHHVDGSGRSGSGTSKPNQEPQTPEVQAQIVSRLTVIAARYLPAVRHAIQLVSAQPELHTYVRKYTKLKDILENPEANLHGIRLGQVHLIEQLLNEIERNPMHLAQQQQQQQQQPQQQAAKAAAASATAASTASSLSHPSKLQSDVRRHTVPTHGSVPPNVDQPRQRVVLQQQPHHQFQQQSVMHAQNRFRVPMTNLNTLLSQPLGVTSPTGMPEGHQSSAHGKPHAQFLTANRALLVSTSPDTTNVAAGVMPTDLHSVRHGLSSAQLESQSNRSVSLAYGFAGQCGSQPRNFGVSNVYSNLQVLASELEKISDRASQDPSFARRVSRAINEISHETKPFREKIGLLLPQDLYLSELGIRDKVGSTLQSDQDEANVPARPISRKRERECFALPDCKASEAEFLLKEDHAEATVITANQGLNRNLEPKEKKPCLVSNEHATVESDEQWDGMTNDNSLHNQVRNTCIEIQCLKFGS